VRLALLIYGILNAILYASLLPLWDGFDEPFHYGYVQTLSRQRTLPRLNESVLSEEVWQSLRLAPASARVKLNLPMVITFGDYFRLDPPARAQLRAALNSLPPSLAEVPSQMLDYEAQHPPLAYLPLAVADILLKDQPLLLRIWFLRLICGIGAVIVTALVTLRLARQMGLPSGYTWAALFVLLSSQMFYAATAHVANDWLAIPLFALVISACIDLHHSPTAASALRAALALAAGLLTKAYFLALLPVAAGVILWLARRCGLGLRPALIFAGALFLAAGPWYTRNLLLYGNVPGMQETTGGVPFASLASAVIKMPWLRALVATARNSLWTGNNSFTAYSATASFVMLGLLALAASIYLRRWTESKPTERIAMAACLCYVAALSYAALLIFRSTRGESVAPPAWHVQALLAPGWCLIFLGLSRSRRLGRWVAVSLVCCWVYLISSTYFAKLIPLYSGYPEPSVRLVRLLSWYGPSTNQAWNVLSLTAIMPAGFVLPLAAVVSMSAVGLAVAVSERA
jgi:hypothetical protein